jgi:hypothetical protein
MKVIILWMRGALVKTLNVHCEGEGLNSLYLQPIYI